MDEARGDATRIARAAAEVWRVRERTEHEAAALFRRLASDLASSGGPSTLVDLATRCASDEVRHASLCRRLVDSLAPDTPPLMAANEAPLGPSAASPVDRALYASVALGCVTESLSTALLIEMRPLAGPTLVRDVITEILEDEVRHSRLGWAHLAFEAERRDVSFLVHVVPEMLRAALDTEGAIPHTELEQHERDALRAYGILPHADVARVTRAAIDDVIIPGLARFGVRVAFTHDAGA